MPKINPYLVLIIAVIGVSISAIFVRFTSAAPEVVAFYRLLFTFGLTLPLAAGTKRYQWKRIRRRELALIFLSALFLALHFTTWFASLRYTSVASSTVLVNTQPFFVILFGLIFLKAPVSKNTLLAVTLAVIGTILLSWSDFSIGGASLFGDGLALVGAVFIAIHYLFSSYLRQSLDTVPYTTLLYGFCTLILAVMVPLGGNAFWGHAPLDYLMCLCLALFSTILGHTLFSWCMRYLSAQAVSLSVLGEPVLAAAIAFFLFQEGFTASQLLGSIIVLLSILGYLLEENKQQQAKSD